MNIKERFENFLDEQKIKKEIELIKAKKAEEARIRESKINQNEYSNRIEKNENFNEAQKENKTQSSENLPVERNKFKFNIEQLKEVGLIATAVVLIGIGYVNFSQKDENPSKVIETASTQYSNNIGDVQLVSSEGSLVENDKNGDKASEENNKDNNDASGNVGENTNNEEKSETKNENKSGTESTAAIDDKNSGKDNSLENDSSNNSNKSNEKTDTNSSDSYFTELKMKRDNIYSQKLEVYSQMINSTTISAEQKAIAIQEVSTLTENQNAILVAEELIKLKGFENVVIYVNGDSVSVVVRSAALSLEQVAQIQNIVSRELKADVSKISISNK